MKSLLENMLYRIRWLVAPICLGLGLTLLLVVIKFFQKLYDLIPSLLSVSTDEVILTALSLIDLVLVAGLIVMVMLSSYENFVATLSIDEDKSEKLSWIGKMNTSSLKD